MQGKKKENIKSNIIFFFILYNFLYKILEQFLETINVIINNNNLSYVLIINKDIF